MRGAPCWCWTTWKPFSNRARPWYATGPGTKATANLTRLAESTHQSCLLLTSREQPLQADDVAVRMLRLEGVDVEAGRTLLSSKKLVGDAGAWRTLVERYSGNPLALRVVGETIGVVFAGDVAAFLKQDVAVFGGIR